MEKPSGEEDEGREEMVDEKIDRLGNEVQYLKKEAEGLRKSLPPITLPPVPEPLLKLRHATREKETERELLLEDQRASKVVEEYLRENPSILEKVEECPICLEPIFDVVGAVTFLCCGKVTCKGCKGPLSKAANNTCPLCRKSFPKSDGEELSILKAKAAEGKSWAQCRLATMYSLGSLGLAVDKRKAEYLYRKAADQGYSSAQHRLGLLEFERNNVSEAVRLCEAAALNGHMNALGLLGIYYLKEGVEKDDIKAVRLLTISAKLQTYERRVHQMLGKCFLNRDGGLERNSLKFIHYMRPAIEETEMPPEIMLLYASTLHAVSNFYYPDYKIAPSGHNEMPEALFWCRRATSQLINTYPIQVMESYESQIKVFCACCYKLLSTVKPKRCVECRAVYYCSRECQAADWKVGHKKDCVKSLKKLLRASGKFDDV